MSGSNKGDQNVPGSTEIDVCTRSMFIVENGKQFVIILCLLSESLCPAYSDVLPVVNT